MTQSTSWYKPVTQTPFVATVARRWIFSNQTVATIARRWTVNRYASTVWRRWLLMIVSILMLSGCTYSTHPVFEEQDNLFDEAFLGTVA